MAKFSESDTSMQTNAMVCSFILLMLHNPEVQKKAQAEIDRVTGGKWVPGMNDRELFPYIDCMIKELFRYSPAVPLVPHSLHEDDVFEGYYIPKGAWVMANMWYVIQCCCLICDADVEVFRGFMHDEERYLDPEHFIPERFETGEGKQPQHNSLEIVFGFGRRYVLHLFIFCIDTLAHRSTQRLSWLSARSLLRLPECHPPSVRLRYCTSQGRRWQGRHSAPGVRGRSCAVSIILPLLLLPAYIGHRHPKPFACDIRERIPERMALIELALQNLQS